MQEIFFKKIEASLHKIEREREREREREPAFSIF
jgi:hypothetical protein